MNLNDVLAALTTAIEATTLHSSASHHDQFRVVDDLTPQSPVRSVEIQLESPPEPADEAAAGFGIGPDPMTCEWSLAVRYGSMQDRPVWGYELQRLVRSLMELPASSTNQTTYAGQIRRVSVAGDAILGNSDPDVQADSYRVFMWRVTTVFDSREP